MPTVTINIPPALPLAMQQFMAKMQDLNKTARQINQNQVAVQQATFQNLNNTVSGMGRMKSLFFRIETILRSTIDTMLRQFGPHARNLIRTSTIQNFTLEAAADDLLRWLGTRIVAGSGPAGLIIAAGYIVTRIVRWFWDRSLKFGEALQRDNLVSLQTGVPLGGLRAFRMGFMSLPLSNMFETNIAKARGDYTSRQAIVLRTLGVSANKSNLAFNKMQPEGDRDKVERTAAMIEILMAARKFMKSVPQGLGLRIAEARGITEFVDKETLIALPQMSQKELDERAAWILANMWKLVPDKQAQDDLKGFFNANLAMWESIWNVLGQKLFDLGVVDLLLKFSKKITSFIDIVFDPELFNKIQKKLEPLYDTVAEEYKKFSKKLDKFLDDIAKMFGKWIAELETLITEIKKPIGAALEMEMRVEFKNITLETARRAGVSSLLSGRPTSIPLTVPFEQPPTGQLPTGQPPVEQPPTRQPRTRQPRFEQPSTGQPPTGQPPRQPSTVQPRTRQPRGPEVSRPLPPAPPGAGTLPRYDPVSGTSLGGGVGSFSASRGRGGHQGDDIMAPHGSPVYAYSNGRIVKFGTDNFGQRTVTIYHPEDGTYSVYLHMGTRYGKVGDEVKGGQQIGTSGTANGVPHLHFERWHGQPRTRGSRLISPRREAGWDKSNLPRGGEPSRAQPGQPPSYTSQPPTTRTAPPPSSTQPLTAQPPTARIAPPPSSIAQPPTTTNPPSTPSSPASQNWDNYLKGITYLETSYTGQSTGNQRGYFQQNAYDVRDATRKGVPNAQNLNKGTYEQQSTATMSYIRAKWPNAAAAIDRGDFQTANSILNKYWVSLPGGSQATQRRSRYKNFWDIVHGKGPRPPWEQGRPPPEPLVKDWASRRIPQASSPLYREWTRHPPPVKDWASRNIPQSSPPLYRPWHRSNKGLPSPFPDTPTVPYNPSSAPSNQSLPSRVSTQTDFPITPTTPYNPSSAPSNRPIQRMPAEVVGPTITPTTPYSPAITPQPQIPPTPTVPSPTVPPSRLPSSPFSKGYPVPSYTGAPYSNPSSASSDVPLPPNRPTTAPRAPETQAPRTPQAPRPPPPIKSPTAPPPPRATGPHSQHDKEVDDYLWSKYQASSHTDSTGPYGWKDQAAAAKSGMTTREYVIGGMSREFKNDLYTAMKDVEAEGGKPKLDSGFRDDFRQSLIKGGVHARTGYSKHGGSQRTGGYGLGQAADVDPATAERIARNRKDYPNISRPMPGSDPYHVQTTRDPRTLTSGVGPHNKTERLRPPTEEYRKQPYEPSSPVKEFASRNIPQASTRLSRKWHRQQQEGQEDQTKPSDKSAPEQRGDIPAGQYLVQQARARQAGDFGQAGDLGYQVAGKAVAKKTIQEGTGAISRLPEGADVEGKPTFYAPGAGEGVSKKPSEMEGGWVTSRKNLEGTTDPRTLDDVRLGKSDYVTLASSPANYHQKISLGDVTYTSPLDGKTYTLHNVKGYVHDTGSKFTDRPDKFDIATGDYRGWKDEEAQKFVTQPYGDEKSRTYKKGWDEDPTTSELADKQDQKRAYRYDYPEGGKGVGKRLDPSSSQGIDPHQDPSNIPAKHPIHNLRDKDINNRGNDDHKIIYSKHYHQQRMMSDHHDEHDEMPPPESDASGGGQIESPA